MQAYQKKGKGFGAFQNAAPAANQLPESPNYQPTQADMGSRVDLPEAMRVKMESCFGMDFSRIQLYQSPTVEKAGANAVAMGNRIAFAPGKLDFSSRSGQELLGHELSHVASQARGEVTGRGILDNSLLEARADREGAMAAAGEQVYTGPVTPLSGSSAMSMSGPMQAKKEKKKTQGEQFEDAYKEMSLPQRVQAMRDLSIGDIEDPSLNKTYQRLAYQIDATNDKAFMDELLRQQSEASAQIQAQYEQRKLQGKSADASMNDDEAFVRTKYSQEAMRTQGYNELLQTIGDADSGKRDKKGKAIKSSGNMYEYYTDNVKEKKAKGEYNYFFNKMNTFATNRKINGKYDSNNQWSKGNDIGNKLDIRNANGEAVSNERFLKDKQADMLEQFGRNRVLPQSKSRRKWLKNQGLKMPSAPKFINDEPTSAAWKKMNELTTAPSPNEKEIQKTYASIAQEQKETIGQNENQIQAFSDYITDSTSINGYLRGDNAESEALKNKVKSMDAGMQTVGANVRALRAVSDYRLIAAIQQNEKLAKKLLKKDKGSGQLRVDYEKLEKDPTLLNGLEFSDQGYSSTSLAESFPENYRQSILKTDAGRANNKMLRDKYLAKDFSDKGSVLQEQIQKGRYPLMQSAEDFDKLAIEDQHEVNRDLKLQHYDDADYKEITEDDLLESGMGSHMYDISVPQGTRGTMVDKLHRDRNGKEQDAGQTELLLDRGTKFKITGLKKLLDNKGVPLKNQYRILMEVIGQEGKKLD